MKRAIYGLVVSLLLSSCATVPAPAPPLTEEQISSMNGAQLCAVRKRHVDPRIDEAMKKKKVDCDPAVLVCESQGVKKGSKKFSSCVTKWRADLEFNQKRLANPAWAFCMDNGFKMGTQAMATCMASWEQRQHQQRMMAMQQQQRMEMQQQQREQAWQALSNQLLLQEQMQQQRRVEHHHTIIQPNRATTRCTFEQHPSTPYDRVGTPTMNCTTW